MKLILPTNYPIVTSYPGRANLFAIEQQFPNLSVWMMERFIDTESLFEPESFKFDIDFFVAPQIRFESNFALEAQNAFCPYIENMSIKTEIIGYNNIVNFIKKCLEEKYYIVLDINTKYILSYDRTFLHNLFIYGFDDDNDIFYIADFFENGHYDFKTCSYEEVKKGAEHFDDLVYLYDNPFGKSMVSLLRVKNYIDHKFSINEFVNNLDEYLGITNNFSNIYKATNYYNKNENRVFGNRHYNNMIKFIELCYENDNWIDNKRAFQVFYEHKKALLKRIEYLNKNIIDCSKELEKMEDIVQNAMNIRNIYLKMIIRKNVSYENYLQIITRINDIRECEKSVLSWLKRELSNKIQGY